MLGGTLLEGGATEGKERDEAALQDGFLIAPTGLRSKSSPALGRRRQRQQQCKSDGGFDRARWSDGESDEDEAMVEKRGCCEWQ